ncbi:hypothetical protein [Desulfosporosinus sp. FKB]|uniref:hypothetical protein n=1 Tax=Desulfosporosinus sp. FKB TaxID=1969835 RepID=UPI000B49949E|nr:hypothetical protein [Desulfosporosinus sp. FKB]
MKDMIPTKRLVARLGISAYDVKAPLSEQEVWASEVKLFFSQRLGAPAQAVVKAGDNVVKGDLIAVIPEGAGLGANLRASILGQVSRVDQLVLPTPHSALQKSIL